MLKKNGYLNFFLISSHDRTYCGKRFCIVGKNTCKIKVLSSLPFLLNLFLGSFKSIVRPRGSRRAEYRNFKHFRHFVILGISMNIFFFHFRNISPQ